MTNETKESMEIDLQKLIIAFLRRWWIIALCTVLAASGTLYYTRHHITPMYMTGVTIYVNNSRADQHINYVSSTNLATAQRLVGTYIEIIQSDNVLEKVADEVGGGVSASFIRSSMAARQKGETELFDVFITHPDPVTAARLANAVAEVAPSEIERFVEGSSAKIVDYAKVPTVPSAPSVTRNTILGALIGFVLAVAYITVRFLMDVRIREEEDLATLFDVPVLGQIPAFESTGKKKKSGYGYEADNNTGKKGEETK